MIFCKVLSAYKKKSIYVNVNQRKRLKNTNVKWPRDLLAAGVGARRNLIIQLQVPTDGIHEELGAILLGLLALG